MALRDQIAKFRSSFQFKLFRLFTLLTAGATFLFSSLYIVTEINENLYNVNHQLQLTANGLADSVRLSLYAENNAALEEAAQNALKGPEIRGVEISTVNDRVLVRMPSGFSATAPGIICKSGDILSNSQIILADKASASRQEVIIGRVRLYRGTEDVKRTAMHITLAAISLGLLFWFIISLSCYQLLRRVTRSFDALMQGLRNVHGGDYTSRVKIRSADELGVAGMALNELAETLLVRERENALLNHQLKLSITEEVAAKEKMDDVNRMLTDEIVEHTRARQELKNLVEHLPVGIIWSDNSGNIQFMNDFIEERFGYSRQELTRIEDWLAKVSNSDDNRQNAEEFRSAALAAWDHQVYDEPFYTVQVRCRDGSLRQLACGNQISAGRIVDILIDVTDREQLQQQILRNQKLESIGVLAAGIAHNFNNVLTGILGYISFARKFLDESHKSYKHLLSAEKSSHRASLMANQLLTFAKGGAPAKKICSVPKMVEESVNLATTGTKTRVSLELDPVLHSVYADDGQLCQAFSCLCINAVQAMPNGGSLTVRGRNVNSRKDKLAFLAEGNYVELVFTDQGCGIAEKDRENIFTPYFTTKALVGTGLGLATVHSIIARHGGAITFESEVGRGTSFHLYLPAAFVSAPEEIGDNAGNQQVLEDAAGEAVLVMDDEELIREFTRSVLENKGYRVTLCQNGEEAISLYREAHLSGNAFLTAILDLTIPGSMDGKESASRILAIDPAACLIVSSGYFNDPVMTDYEASGFRAAIVKPYSADELLGLVGTMRSSRAQS